MNSISIVKKRFFNEDGTPADPNRRHQVQYALVPVNGSDEFEMEQDLLHNIANRRMLWLRRPSDIANDEVTLRFFSSEPPPPLSVKHCETQVAPQMHAQETQTPIPIMMTTGIQVEPDKEAMQTQTVSPDRITRVHCATQVQPQVKVIGNRTSLSDAFEWPEYANDSFECNDEVDWIGDPNRMIPKQPVMEPKEEPLDLSYGGFADMDTFLVPKEEPTDNESMEPLGDEYNPVLVDQIGEVANSSLFAEVTSDHVEMKPCSFNRRLIKTEVFEPEREVYHHTKKRAAKKEITNLMIKVEDSSDEGDYRTPKTA
ncbi:hypothetical protein PMAYCL1PPCAC_31484, partial [Pristionchus mayeri]